MHEALAAYLQGEGTEHEAWEVDALATLTWRESVPFTAQVIGEMHDALRETCRPAQPAARARG